jgi:hypothetical protein
MPCNVVFFIRKGTFVRIQAFSLRGMLILGAAVSALAVSCEMSTGLLSESERSSLYTLTLASKSISSIANGAVLAPGAELDVSVVRRSGASALAVLDCSLLNLDGSSASALRFVSATVDSSKAKPAGSASSTKVSRVEGKLQGFSIPSDQVPGAYKLSVAAVGSEGTVLQQETISIFVGSAAPAIDSAPAVEPGAPALLGLSVSWTSLASSAEGGAQSSDVRDPWIRWSRNGSTFAEGLQSAGFAKTVWTSPRAEGAYSIRAEVFPAAPSEGGSYSFKAVASQDLRVMVIDPVGESGDDFADALAFHSLLKFDGGFDDSGTRLRTEQPAPTGAPALDAYPGGFGYRFGPSAGVSVPGLMPPSTSGKLGAFAVLVRLAPDGGQGNLVRFASPDSSYVLSLGLDGGKPYVESRIGGSSRRSLASSSVPSGPISLEAILKPEGDSLTVSWRADGERIDAPSIPLPPAPPAGSATLGGADSLPGVYDGFGLMLPGAISSYPSPTFRLASRRRWKSSLILAEGFEDGVLPPSSSASGSTSMTSRGLVLKDGGSITLAPQFSPGAGIAIEVGIEGDRGSCLVDFLDSDGKRVFSIRGTGEVLDASGAVLGAIPLSGSKIDFSIEQRDGKTRVVGNGGAPAYVVSGFAGRYSLSFRQAGGVSQAIVYRALVRPSSSSTSR